MFCFDVNERCAIAYQSSPWPICLERVLLGFLLAVSPTAWRTRQHAPIEAAPSRGSMRSVLMAWCFGFAMKSLRLQVGSRDDLTAGCLECELPGCLLAVSPDVRRSRQHAEMKAAPSRGRLGRESLDTLTL